MKVVIIDDEPLAVELLALYVQKTPFLELIRTYNSAVEALENIETDNPDLLLLDIQMPELTGMEMAHQIPDHTMVIFTTAFPEYALESYKVNTIDYLIKPVPYETFQIAAQKAWRRYCESESSHAQAYLYVKSDYKRIRIHLSDILYIEGLKDYVKIHMAEGHVVTLLSMKSLERYLPAERFLRVHRSFIVNMDHVAVIDRQGITIQGVNIPLSDSYREGVMAYTRGRMVQ